MFTDSNIQIEFWKLPKSLIPELEDAYSKMEYFWLISIWNEYELTETICPSCPASIDKVKKHFPEIIEHVKAM